MMNILLPTDFSENSRNAAAYAVQLFKQVTCTFHLLHVVPIERSIEHSAAIPKAVQEQFDDLLSWLGSQGKNPRHSFHICFKKNYFIEAVREKVKEKNIDLILMGTKGITNKKDLVLGKNTSDVMMKVKCSAMAISEKAVFKTHKEILFPTDYKIHYTAKMLETLMLLSGLSKASVKILELYNSKEEPSPEQVRNRQHLTNSFFPSKPGVQTYYSYKNPPSSSLFTSNENVDMIVMAARNLNLCQRLLKNQVNTQIPFIRNLPLLVLHG